MVKWSCQEVEMFPKYAMIYLVGNVTCGANSRTEGDTRFCRRELLRVSEAEEKLRGQRAAEENVEACWI